MTAASNKANGTPFLDLPGWLPQPVRNLAREMYEYEIKNGASRRGLLLRRLASDPRMAKVWKELQKKKRRHYKSTEEFFYPAAPSGRSYSWSTNARAARRRAAALRKAGGRENRSEARRWDLQVEMAEVRALWSYSEMKILDAPANQDTEARHNAALAFIFNEAFLLAAEPRVRAVTMSEAKAARRPYLKMAERLRADSKQIGLSKFRSLNPLLAAAFFYEELADRKAPSPNDPLLVRRSGRDARLRGYVITLAETNRQIFKVPLYGIIANVVNVVFKRDDLTARAVREILR